MTHIGIDAKRAFHNKTGLGQYSRWMLQYYRDRNFFQNKFLFTPKKGPYYQPEPLQEQVITRNSVLPSALWRSYRIPKLLEQLDAQTYHGLTNELPFFPQNQKVRKIVTIHDVLFKKIPETYGFIDRKTYDYKTDKACKTADDIIVVSEQTKRDLVDLYDANPKKIHVIHQDCHEQFRQKIKTPSKESYILSVGTIEPRKNHHLLIEALVNLPKHIKVCIAGKRTSYHEELTQLAKKLHVDDRVEFVFDFEFQKLPELIHHAKFCCYLSENEGFGIPILEYMSMGKPVVLPKTPLAQEVAGDAGVFTSLDAMELSKTINGLDVHDEHRKKLGELSKKRATAFETPRLYLQLDKLFEKTT